MRIFLLLFPFWCFGQLNLSTNEIRYSFPIDGAILGDWYLMETVVRPEFRNDSIPIMRFADSGIKRITFTEDSLFIHPWSTRFYRRTEKYNYELNGNEINLFIGVKKKRKQLDQLQIARCYPEVLILSTTKEISDPLGRRLLTTHYIYHRRPDYKTEISKFNGKWSACNNEHLDLLKDGGQSELTLSREPDCESEIHRLEMNFSINDFKLQEEVTMVLGSVFEGVYVRGIEFFIDTKKKFLYLASDKIMVYSYEFLDSDSLRLEFNRGETERLKVKK